MSISIVFMGSPDFALSSLIKLNDSYQVVGVITQPDRPAGRGRKVQSPPVKFLADKLSIPVIQPQKLSEEWAMVQLRTWQPDLIVVAAFGQILKKEVLDLPRLGCINVHASLLPRWRGASPIQAAILNGDKNSGVTIMKMAIGLDDGPILAQREILIEGGMTGGTLSDCLSTLGAQVLQEILPSYINGMIAPYPQEDQNVTHAKKLSKSDGELDFSQTAQQLKQKVHAFNPWPGTYFDFNQKMIKVHLAHTHDTFDSIPGEHYIANGRPAIGTGLGLLVLDEIQPAGKKPMVGEAFLNGTPNWI